MRGKVKGWHPWTKPCFLYTSVNTLHQSHSLVQSWGNAQPLDSTSKCKLFHRHWFDGMKLSYHKQLVLFEERTTGPFWGTNNFVLFGGQTTCPFGGTNNWPFWGDKQLALFVGQTTGPLWGTNNWPFWGDKQLVLYGGQTTGPFWWTINWSFLNKIK